MKLYKYITVGAVALMMAGTVSCTGDLDLTPTDPNLKLELSTPEEWYGYFGSIYGTLVYDNGVSVSDGGAGVWMRCQWNLQEIAADEAIITNKWNDPGYHALNFNSWLTDNEWVYASFTREFYTAKQASEFIAQADKAANAGVSKDLIEQMKSECRVIRALAYYYMIDLFGRGPWITENSITGETPPTYNRTELFDATVADLVDVINNGSLVPAAQQVYGRLSKEAARMLLAKLYLNSEVYTGVPRYTECAAQCKEILKTLPPSKLAPEYKYLFCADNDQYVGNGEIIWAIPQQHGEMETWGNTTYLTAGAYIETVPQEELMRLGAVGAGSVWSGLRMRPELSQALIENGGSRNLAYVGQFNIGVQNLDNYDETSDGYMCVKYTYTSSDDYYNEAQKMQTNQVADADFPIFRLADTMLMLTECQIRGVADADPNFEYFNAVRARAGLPAKPYVSEQDLLTERQCELYWEGHRRSDLIRFHRYTGSTYNWSWKGGVYEGASLPDYRALYAIPYQYVSTIGQNTGY